MRASPKRAILCLLIARFSDIILPNPAEAAGHGRIDGEDVGNMKPYLEDQESVLSELGSSMKGLTDAEAAARLTRYGPN